MDENLQEVELFEQEVRDAFERMRDPIERDAIWKKYVEDVGTWVKVAMECGYSERSIYNVRDRGIQHLGEELEKSWEIRWFLRYRQHYSERKNIHAATELPDGNLPFFK